MVRKQSEGDHVARTSTVYDDKEENGPREQANRSSHTGTHIQAGKRKKVSHTVYTQPRERVHKHIYMDVPLEKDRKIDTRYLE